MNCLAWPGLKSPNFVGQESGEDVDTNAEGNGVGEGKENPDRKMDTLLEKQL